MRQSIFYCRISPFRHCLCILQFVVGVGFAKNRAIAKSCGEFLCFCDADDVFLSCRIVAQLKVALQCDNPSFTLIGGKFKRIPEFSTERYTKWANSLNSSQLYKQVIL